MGLEAALLDGLFAPRYSFQDFYSLLQVLKRLHIHEVRRRLPVFRDQNRDAALFQLGEDFCGLTFQGGDEMGFHAE